MKDDMKEEQKIDLVDDEQFLVDDGIWLKVYESAGLAKRFKNNKVS